MKNKKTADTQVLIGDTFNMLESLNYFKINGASHYIIIKKNIEIPDVLGYLMVGYKNYDEAESHLHMAIEIGDLYENKIYNIDDDLNDIKLLCN